MKNEAVKAEGYEVIDISKITESKNNYRKTFDPKAMEELTASVSECMDRGCFFDKTMDSHKARIEERKSDGFQALTNAKKVSEYTNNSRYQTIQAPGNGNYPTVPKKYKTECMKCLDNHVFYLYEGKDWRGKKIEHGEICLNKKCLDKMNRPASADKKEDGEETSGVHSEFSLRQKARECRDRFLKRELPGKVQSEKVEVVSLNLKDRLLIYSLLLRYRSFAGRTEIIKKYNPEYQSVSYESAATLYRVIASVQGIRLTAMLDEVLVASIDDTDTDVLLAMTEEAGIDMTKDFGVDRDFLNTKTKDDLIAYAKEFGLEVAVTASSKKGEILDAIMQHDLKGKFTKECIEVCRITNDEDVVGGAENPCTGACDECKTKAVCMDAD